MKRGPIGAVRGAFGAAVLLSTVLPHGAFAETWHGKIRCEIIPGVISKILIADFVVNVEGGSITYSRPVHVRDSRALSGVVETGTGTISAGILELQGGAATTGYRYVADYRGPVGEDHVVLTGEQVWSMKQLPAPYHRACRIRLRR